MKVTNRYDDVLERLAAAYPDAGPELEFSTPFELLVATMLSAQCTDKQVNRCTRPLFAKWNTAAQFASLSEDELFPYIMGCGLYRNKGRNIIAASAIIDAEYGGRVPDTREALTALPGVGRKTANVVLSNAYGVDAIAVDTHVQRVANRIGLAHSATVEKTEQQLMENIPKDKWSIAHHWLIFHGRRCCHARSPECGRCTLSEICEDYIERHK